jgi:drug/metabolite transporter (DMT)-like permease
MALTAGRRRASPMRIAAAFAAVYTIWGSTFLGIHYAIETIPPLLMAGSRFVLSGVVLYAWARLRGSPRPVAEEWRAGAVIGALLPLAGNGAVVWAEQRNPSGITALFVAIMPACMALLEWLRPGGSRPTRWALLGLVTGTAGVALLVDPRTGGAAGDRIDLVAAGLLLCGSFAWAAGSLYSRSARLPASPIMATALQMLAGGTFLLTAGALIGEVPHFAWTAVTARSAMAFAYLFVFGSLIGFTSYAWLLQVVAPTKVATYAYVNPVVAVLLGWLIAGEPLTARTALAGVAIVGAVVLITTSKNRPSANRPSAGDRATSRDAGAAP